MLLTSGYSSEKLGSSWSPWSVSLLSGSPLEIRSLAILIWLQHHSPSWSIISQPLTKHSPSWSSINQPLTTSWSIINQQPSSSPHHGPLTKHHQPFTIMISTHSFSPLDHQWTINGRSIDNDWPSLQTTINHHDKPSSTIMNLHEASLTMIDHH